MAALVNQLRRLERSKLGRWALLSGFSFLLNVGIAVGLNEVFGVPPELSVSVSLTTVFVTNFLIMRHYVFRAASGRAFHQLVSFLFSSLAFRGGEYVSFLAGHTWLGLPEWPTFITILLVSMVIKYFVYGFVFRGARQSMRAVSVSSPELD